MYRVELNYPERSAFYSCDGTELKYETRTNSENSLVGSADVLFQTTYNTRLLYILQPRLTVWKASKKSYNAQLGLWETYLPLLKYENSELLFKGRAIFPLAATTIIVKQKYWGLATELALLVDGRKIGLCHFGNHGKILQSIDVAPDPWFEESDDYAWAMELAYVISQAMPACRPLLQIKNARSP